ncbi:hypothetical protein [Tabrizicola sp.]|uniref:hypothetical protein n=1 Tax=Tabrizicola sp. TaxID=2005166 RepID=UPI002734CC88|nr:hypothetical protein [Tabrizicola sp.]MDP3196174.1 hypothetical protein [Tabrizicola sp.]
MTIGLVLTLFKLRITSLKTKNIALAALIATMPTFAMADPIAASLGASFGGGLDVALIDVGGGLVA